MSDARVVLSDGSSHEVAVGTPVGMLARRLDLKGVVGVLVDGRARDLSTPIDTDAKVEFLTFDDPGGREVYWHSTSHLMAQAVKELFPNAKLAIGPPIEDGFYYDFDIGRPFTPEDLERIEARWRLAKADQATSEKTVGARLRASRRRGRVYSGVARRYSDGVLRVTSGVPTGGAPPPNGPDQGRSSAVDVGCYWRDDDDNGRVQAATAFYQ